MCSALCSVCDMVCFQCSASVSHVFFSLKLTGNTKVAFGETALQVSGARFLFRNQLLRNFSSCFTSLSSTRERGQREKRWDSNQGMGTKGWLISLLIRGTDQMGNMKGAVLF